MKLDVIPLLMLFFPPVTAAGEVKTEFNGHDVTLTVDEKYAVASVPNAGFLFVSFPVPEGTEARNGAQFSNIPCELSVGIYQKSDHFFAREEQVYKQNPAYKVEEEASENGRVYIMKSARGDGTDNRRRQYIETDNAFFVVDASWLAMRGYPSNVRRNINREFMSVLNSIQLDGVKWDGVNEITLAK